jgi:hypothetical protein
VGVQLGVAGERDCDRHTASARSRRRGGVPGLPSGGSAGAVAIAIGAAAGALALGGLGWRLARRRAR